MKAKKDSNPIGGNSNTEHHTFSYGFLWLLHAATNFGLLALAAVLGLLSLFASLEIVLSIGAQVIWDSMGDTVQAKYTLVLLRNIWLLVGGIVLLVVIIYCINRFFKRWHDMRVQRVYIWLLVVEALIVLAQIAISN